MLYCRGSKWNSPSRLNGKLVLIKAHGFGMASQAQGAHEHRFAPALLGLKQVPLAGTRLKAANTAIGETAPRELRKVHVGAQKRALKGWGGKKIPSFFTSCRIMNSPFQGMCEFLLGPSESCKTLSGNVCPSF